MHGQQRRRGEGMRLTLRAAARYAALLLATTTIGALIPAWHAVRAAPAGLLASSGA